jgi:hypothetical protein
LARQGTFNAPKTTIDRATKSGLPIIIIAYDGMRLVRKKHLTMLRIYGQTGKPANGLTG